MLGKLDFKEIEKRLSQDWEETGVYKFNPSSKKPVYSIDSPPPFTSGALHMGHVLAYSYFDFAARFKRMAGHSVFFPQGWDCQGFPTEVKVEKKFGRDKLSRLEFRQKCLDFTHENIKAMKNQLIQIGHSPDWSYEYKTIDADYHRKVQLSLLLMKEKNLVYRQKHPVLFCTNCRSAIAKAETDDENRQTKLNYLVFKAEKQSDEGNKGEGGKEGSVEDIIIATTRPELLHALLSVLVNPTDEKNKHLIGATAVSPHFNKRVPILADEDVDPLFGTGIVMNCSFGDKQDVVWAYRHKLTAVEAIDVSGRLVNAGELNGLKVAPAKEKIIELLKDKELLKKQDDVQQVVKTHDRCGKPVELLATNQWFISVKDHKEKIIEAAKSMRWVPSFSIQYLVDWTNFIEWDWVISRQNVYGTPIPFWHCGKCGKIFEPKKEELPVDPALHKFKHAKECECGGEIIGETAVCDCWVDSSITPLVISGWEDGDVDKRKLFNKVYPVSLRPQGLEIIRTWAFYTIFRSLVLTGEPCFKDVLINGNVLGTDGKKMSKSAGNFEDPNALFAKYSADAIRQWAALSGAFAKDRPFNYKDIEYSQSFLNKLWNAGKFVQASTQDYDGKKVAYADLRATDKWVLSRLNQLVKKATKAMNEYDYYSAITAIQGFVWHEFCDYYLEDVKYRTYGSDAKSKKSAQYALKTALLTSLKLLAPFAPFVTDEIYREFSKKPKSIHQADWPAVEEEFINESVENICAQLHSILSKVRKFKATNQIALNEELESIQLRAKEVFIKELPLIEEEIKQVGKIRTIEPKEDDNAQEVIAEPRMA